MAADLPPPARHPPHAERLQALEHALEGAVDAALERGERTLARRFGTNALRGLRRTLKALGVAALVVYFLFGALLLAVRYAAMPQIDALRPWIERRLTAALDAPVTIGRIDAGWRGFNPRLALHDLRLSGPAGETRLALPQVEAELSWSSVPRLALRLASLSVQAPELEVRRLDATRFTVAGFALEPRSDGGPASPLLDWVLAQHRISLHGARVVYVDAAGAAPGAAAPPSYTFTDLQFTMTGGLASTRLSLQARPPAGLAGALDVRGQFRHGWLRPASEFSAWRGELYLQLDGADLARSETVARLLPAPMTIERAEGALRAWAAIDHGSLRRLTADVALANLRAQLGDDLPPLQVDALRGRLTQREWGSATRGGQEFAAQQLTLEGAGLALPPTDLHYRSTRGGPGRAPRIEFEASRLPLEPLTRLAAQLPLAPALRQALAAQAPRGTLSALHVDLDGAPQAPDRYAVSASFDGLALAAQPAEPALDAQDEPRLGQPGFDNLAGRVEITDAGGSVTIDARAATLTFPGVFAAPLAFDRLALQGRYAIKDGRLAAQITRFAAANRDLDFSGSGSYARSLATGGGPGQVDLSARVNALTVAAAPRYVPLVAGADTRHWLAQGLVGGQGGGGSVRLRGDLRDFPFRDPRRGEFRAALRVQGGILDYLPATTRDGRAQPGWPRIEDIDAEVVFERQALAVTSQRARILGTQVLKANARIADLDHPQSTLEVRGSTRGPAADLLRYVADSELRDTLHFLAGARAEGSAQLDLSLHIPLVHAADTRVAGSIQLAGNDIALADLPPFTRASGRIDFTEHSLTIGGLNAGFLGGQLAATAATQTDGAIVVNGSGSATPAGVAALADLAPLQRLLARSQGSARYTGTLTVRDGHSDLRVDSDLAGWTIDAPAPLGKLAADALPLRLELAGLGGERDQIAATAGSALALQLARSSAGGRGPRIERGAVALGGRAVLPERGLAVAVNLPRFDADAWLTLLDPAAGDGRSADGGAASAAAALLPDTVNLRTRELVAGGKTFANVTLGATRRNDGGETLWQATVGADEVSGSLEWRPGAGSLGGSGAGAGKARLSARLTRLAIPESRRSEVAQLLDAPPLDVPDIDLVAEHFELGGRALGRLELAASNGGSAAQPVWTLQRLALGTPEATLQAHGGWQHEAGRPGRHMQLSFGLDFSNAGALLARLGIPGALRGGEGRLEGELGWRGSPLAIHYPTLAGHLKLSTSKGQFLKADAGAGRLLGVLSLQSLPRRITLDFRDVFSEGFAFDSIGATADVADGVLSTRDFRMRGPNANVLIEGSADLDRETQTLHVLVLPEVNAGSASLAYALLANPAIGLGTFLAQLVLRDPLSKAFSFEYDVTGGWADPQVRRRERAGAPEAGATR